MACGACGPAVDKGQEDMYKALEAKVKAEEAEKKRLERERRVSEGLPEKGQFFLCSFSVAELKYDGWERVGLG